MMSAKSDLAVRAVVHLARQLNSCLSLETLATAIQTTPVMMSEIMSNLLHANMVSTPHGPQGGFRLLRRPESLSFYDVISAVEPTSLSARLRSTTHTKKLDETRTQLEATYRSITIAQYLRDGTKI